MTDFKALSVFTLKDGAHDNASEGLCAMEAVAWLEGLEHSDRPACTCPVIAMYVRCINDNMPDDVRQGLVPYLPKLVGTVSPDHEKERSEFLAWQAVRVFAPLALRSTGFEEWALKLEAQNDLKKARKVAAAAARITKDKGDFTWAAYWAEAATEAATCGSCSSASYAAFAAWHAGDWSLAFKALDGVLAIGPSGKPFSRNTEEAVAAYRELVGAA